MVKREESIWKTSLSITVCCFPILLSLSASSFILDTVHLADLDKKEIVLLLEIFVHHQHCARNSCKGYFLVFRKHTQAAWSGKKAGVFKGFTNSEQVLNTGRTGFTSRAIETYTRKGCIWPYRYPEGGLINCCHCRKLKFHVNLFFTKCVTTSDPQGPPTLFFFFHNKLPLSFCFKF